MADKCPSQDISDNIRGERGSSAAVRLSDAIRPEYKYFSRQEVAKNAKDIYGTCAVNKSIDMGLRKHTTHGELYRLRPRLGHFVERYAYIVVPMPKVKGIAWVVEVDSEPFQINMVLETAHGSLLPKSRIPIGHSGNLLRVRISPKVQEEVIVDPT